MTNPRLIRNVGRLAVVALAVAYTWAAVTAHSMNADGVVYLDMGDALWKGDWALAVNPVWSPLYGWLLGTVMHFAQPGIAYEFALVHVVNLAVFIFTFACFEILWQRLWRAGADQAWSEPIWWGLGYTLFAWATLTLIELWAVTPDMLMAGWVLLAAALYVEIVGSRQSWAAYLAFGLVLGLGYLTKAIMLPVSAIMLFVALFTAKRRSLLLLSGLAFALLSAPYILAISQDRGELSWGDAGNITYVRYVNGLPYPHWQGGPPENGYPVHPSRQILSWPPIYEFDGPVGGTYPISTDPVYWYEGAQRRFDLGQQLAAVTRSALFYVGVFVEGLGIWLALLIFLRLRRRKHRDNARRLNLDALQEGLARWGLAVPALSALLAYAIVYVEGRYAAVFVLLIMGTLLAQHPRSERAETSVVGLIMIIGMVVQLGAFGLQGAADLSANIAPSTVSAPAPSSPTDTAEALHALGIVQGDKVGVIGYGFDAFWARLARVQIVAELLENDALPFWYGETGVREDVIEAFASTGVAAIVAERAPHKAELPGWHQIGDSSFYVYLFDNP